MSAKEKLDKKNLTRILLASIYLKTNKLKSKKKKKSKTCISPKILKVFKI